MDLNGGVYCQQAKILKYNYFGSDITPTAENIFKTMLHRLRKMPKGVVISSATPTQLTVRLKEFDVD